ncbi:MAG: hypothetical protein GXY96_04945 [Tissierellia bacterium]|nr:hypothetical protein [Tissierellia bacterium]
MDDIEGLWELQKNESLLLELGKKLKEVQNGKNLKTIAAQLEEKEKAILKLKSSVEERENSLNKENLALEELDFKLKEREKNLFHGNILDLKQLTLLNEEREKLKEEIEEKENKILTILEDIDDFKLRLAKLEKDFKDLKKEYRSLVKEYKSILEELNEESIRVKERIKKISSSLDRDLLLKFKQLVDNKGVAVVEVIDNRCGGCNMVLPAMTVDRLKHSQAILHCENCDRILYLDKKQA